MVALLFNVRIKRIRNGDNSALDEIYNEYHEQLKHYATAFVGETEAEDVASNTLLHIYDIAATQKYILHPTAWLYKNAHNLCMNLLRGRERCVSFEALENRGLVDLNRDLSLTNLNLKIDIQNAIELLSPEHREMIIMYYYGRLSEKVIAEIKGIPYETLKWQMRRARVELKNLLADYENY